MSRQVHVPISARGDRVDAFLAGQLALSRSRLQTLLENGDALVDGRRVRSSTLLKGNEAIAVRLPPVADVALVPEDLPLDVLFEDDALMVINKAAGMAVHPGAGLTSGTVANAVLARCPSLSISGERRPGIVHRLDKDTSGALVIAKTDRAHHALAAAFAQRQVQKRYLAICLGRLKTSPLELVTGHRRADHDRRRFTTRLPAPASTTAGGVRRAHSVFTERSCAGGVSVLDVELHTGRTHQIRAHAADVGHPLLQDVQYGGGQAHKRLPDGPVRDAVLRLHRQALHALSLAFTHPVTAVAIAIAAPLPRDMQDVIDAVAGAAGAP